MADQDIKKMLFDIASELNELQREFKSTTDPREECQLLLRMQEILIMRRRYMQAIYLDFPKYWN